MHLREGEVVLKVYHHHPTPFVYDLLKVFIGAFPFFLLSYFFQPAMSASAFFALQVGIFVLFALIIIYVSLIYWLDKLVITNMRVVFINWKYLTMKDEAEAMLSDIQDIQTEENGLLATLWIFDYGLFRLDTASSYVTIEFPDAPDPEGIRRFIYHLKKQ